MIGYINSSKQYTYWVDTSLSWHQPATWINKPTQNISSRVHTVQLTWLHSITVHLFSLFYGFVLRHLFWPARYSTFLKKSSLLEYMMYLYWSNKFLDQLIICIWSHINIGNILWLGNNKSILNLAKPCLSVCVYVMFLSCFVTSPITLISRSWKKELTQNSKNVNFFKKVKMSKKSKKKI